MDKKTIQQKMQKLIKTIQYHDHQYYDLDDPKITDKDYDVLYQELVSLEKKYPFFTLKDSPTQKIPGNTAIALKTIAHQVPMLSLTNAMSQKAFLEFDARTQKLLKQKTPITYFCELKFDGLSLSLTYQKGTLLSAATRGNGILGENVTANVQTISSIPLQLNTPCPPEFIEIRGEILIDYKDFETLNHNRQQEGKPLFANPRNAAAGSLRQIDPQVTAARPLKGFFYGFGAYDSPTIPSLEKYHQLLKTWKIPTHPEKALCTGAEEVLAFFQKIQTKRSSLPFAIDGIVVKINDLQQLQQAGVIARSPRGMIALKYPSTETTSVIEDVLFQVGRTGTITPVAILTPTLLNGITIQRASLHNQDMIQKKDIRISDTVTIRRAGDVIPEIVGVVLSHRLSHAQPILFPKNCPSCQSICHQEPGGAAIRCVSLHCPAQLLERMTHFCSKDALNIKGCSEKILKRLMDQGLIQRPYDLYTLTKAPLLAIKGFSNRSAQNLLDSIAQSQTTEASRFLFGLGIRHVGKETAQRMMQHFSHITDLFSLSFEALLSQPHIGEKIAHTLVVYFKNPENQAEVRHLLKKIHFSPQLPSSGSSGPPHFFSEKNCAITGTFSSFSRDALKKILKSHGAIVTEQVSSKTHFLLIGNEPGSKKKKAQALQIPCIPEEKLLNILLLSTDKKKTQDSPPFL